MKKKIAVLAALLLCGAFSWTQNIRATSAKVDKLIQRDPYVDPRWYGAKCDGTSDDSAAFQNAITDIIAAYPGKPLLVPGFCKVHGLAHQSGVYYMGLGSTQSGLIHADGFAEPLIYVTGGVTGTPTPASPSFGYSGLTLQAGSATTAIIYYDGRIDNNVKCEDLDFIGNTSTTNTDAFSVKDYLNWHCHQVRFDGIGGYAFNVRGAVDFANSSFSLDGFTYDNQHGASGGTWGKGLFSMDTTALAGVTKGPIEFANARIEMNEGLTTSVPQRALIRVATDPATGFPQNPLAIVRLRDISVDANGAGSTSLNGRNFKLVGSNLSNVAVNLDTVQFFGMAEVFNNDAGTVMRTLPGSVGGTRTISHWSSPSAITTSQGVSGWTQFGGINWWTTDSDANLANLIVNPGDVVQYKLPWNASGRVGRPFAYKATTSNSNGRGTYTFAAPATITTTGTATSASAVISLGAAVPDTALPGRVVTVVGAGSAGADLTAQVISTDLVAKTITLETNASTSVTGTATVKTAQATLFTVDMVQYGTGAPSAGTYAQGDKVINATTPAPCGNIGWVNTTAGTPGTWQPFGLVGTGGGAKNPWASPCAIGGTDPNVGSFTNLNASGTTTLNGHVASGTALGYGTVAGCLTGSTVGAACTVNVAWGVALADTSYRAVCGGRLVTSGVPVNGAITAQSTTAVTFQTVAATAAGAQFTNIDCIAIHP